MVAIKSLVQLLSEQKTFLRSYNPGIDVGDNSLVKDIVLTPLSVGGSAVYNQLSTIQTLHILSQVPDSDLDDFASNYRLERRVPTNATVILTFYTENTPTQEIVIAAGTQVSTVGTSLVSPLIFITTTEARFTVEAASTLYSYNRDRYEFQVTAISTIAGSAGNIGNNRLNHLISSVTGITGVTNLVASSGGYNTEGADDFRKRIQAAILGRDINTASGLKSYIQSLGFLDAYTVRLDSADAERTTGVDVFVIDSSSGTMTDTFVYDPAQSTYYLAYRPVLTVASVTSSSYGTLTVNTDYDVHLDYTTAFRRSTLGQDYIRILNPSIARGELITVTYTYSSLVYQSQATLTNPVNNVLTAKPMIKLSMSAGLYLWASLTLMANSDGPSTRAQCKNALTQFMSTYRLNQSVQKSDLTVVLQNGYGNYPVTTVDSVRITNYYLQDALGNIYLPVNEVISVSSKMYATFGAATIV